MSRLSILFVVLAGPLLVITGGCSDEQQRPDGEARSMTASAMASPAIELRAETGAPAPDPSASAPPLPILPRPVRFAPDEVVTVPAGIFYVDPRSGAVEGWAIPARGWLPHVVSPGGRYFAYGVATGGNPPASNWLLVDTQTNGIRGLSSGDIEFSPDETRLAEIGANGVTVARSDDGAVERIFPIPRLRPGVGVPPQVVWSPDGQTLLAWYSETPTTGLTGRVLLLSPADGVIQAVSDQALPWVAWSPDGGRFFVLEDSGQAIAAHDTSNQRLWTVSLDDLGLSSLRTPATGTNGVLETPRVSPDGSLVAVPVRGPASAPLYRVYVLDAMTGEVRYWLEGAYLCGPNAWTADGRSLMAYGSRAGVHGAHLVAADGSAVQFLSEYVEDLSPVDTGTGGRPGGRSIEVVDIPAGTVRRTVTFTGDVGWDFADRPLWLADGRMVVHAPHLGHGGCGEGPPIMGQISVQFPP